MAIPVSSWCRSNAMLVWSLWLSVACSIDGRTVSAGDGSSAGGSGGASALPGANTPALPDSAATPEASAAANDGVASAASPESPLGVVAMPEAVFLGSIPVGTPSSPVAWVITNQRAVDLTGLTLSEDAAAPLVDFTVLDGCGARLVAGGSCTFQVTYRPSQSGTVRRTLRLAWFDGETRLTVNGVALPWLEVRKQGAGRVTSVPPGIDCGDVCRAPFEREEEVQLVATPVSGEMFGGWRADECEPLAGDCRLASFPNQSVERIVPVAFFTPANNLVFISSEGLSPVLGGVAPYDAACNRLASAAGLNPAGDGFIAAISDATSHFADRLGTARGWVRMDGRPFGDTREEIVNEGIVYNTVAYTELGELVTGDAHMSGTLADGALGLHCDNWSSTSAELTEGNPFTEGPGAWMGTGSLPISGANPCDPAVPRRVVCLGNSATGPLLRTPRAGKRIWLSNTQFFPGGLSPDEACQAERPSGVTSAVALVAYSDRAASDSIDPSADYVRPDGEIVGTGARLIEASQAPSFSHLETGLWQTADGSYLRIDQFSIFVWSGSQRMDALGEVESNCGDWLDQNQQGYVGRLGVTQSQFWARGATGSCADGAYLICVEP